MSHINSKVIALIGGGPAALFFLKHIILKKIKPETIYIFEKNERLGVGMPYGKAGSGYEHVANVSANEIPKLTEDIEFFIQKHSAEGFDEYLSDGIINRDQVIPRLLLGNYLENQFLEYIKLAKSSGIKVETFTNTEVKDIINFNESEAYSIITGNEEKYQADVVILSTGHQWPRSYENTQKGWYDSPYPPSKFNFTTNYPVAVKGASLTAVDVIRTLSRQNGNFIRDNNRVEYVLKPESENFRIDLYSLSGFLPALRFHSEDEAYSSNWKMSLNEIFEYKRKHGGFVDLNYVFDKNFKMPLQKKDPEFYNEIKDLSIEEFVEKMMKLRKELDSFELFKAEYAEAEKSIRRHQSISWKEALTAFSYTMNYPAKHFSAEDMIRLNKVLMPLISIIIAALPQSSYREVIALYDAGIIRLNNVNPESRVKPQDSEGAIYQFKDDTGNSHEIPYQMYVDATGQRAMNFNDLPFDGLKEHGTVSAGYLSFKDENEAEKELKDGNKMVKTGANNNFYLQVKGLNINDYFQALDSYGNVRKNLYIMSVAYIGGLNPDYSGLDFCDTAGEIIVNSMVG